MKPYFLSSVALLAVTSCMSAQSDIDGLWRGALQSDDGKPVAIDIVMQNSDAITDAGVATVRDNQLSIAFDDGASFSGTISTQAAAISGFYIQPGNEVGGQQLAHAVNLVPNDSGGWTGVATPLARGFSVYMNIENTEGVKRIAMLINPERNITGPARRYDILGDAEAGYSLNMQNDGSLISPVELSEAPVRLNMNFGPMEGFELLPVNKGSNFERAFHGDRKSSTLTPPSRGGSWPVGAARDVGFDETALEQLVSDISSESGAAERPNLIHSLLVARNGKLVVEEYFRGYDRDTPHDIRSAGKTFASILIGALKQQGAALGADTPINQFISVPNEKDGAPITLGDLLTHRSGLDCYDGNRETGGHEDKMWQNAEDGDLWRFIANLDTVAMPGTRYAYCSGGMNLIGAALSGSTDESVLSLLQTRLFEPLEFKNAYWNVMANGEAYLGGGAYLRTRDLAKIGQLYLDKGQWRGEQLIDREWAINSVLSKTAITPETTGLDEDAFNRFYFGGEDGYGWHRHLITIEGQTYETYEASGNGGQIVVIIPDLDLVAAMTGGNYGEGFIWGKWRQKIVAEGIVAALTDS